MYTEYEFPLHALTAMIAVCRGTGDAEEFGAMAVGAEVDHRQLKQMLTYPPDWGPTEWGPIPFLPQPDVLVSSMERQWGDLAAYKGIATTATGKPPVSPLPSSCISCQLLKLDALQSCKEHLTYSAKECQAWCQRLWMLQCEQR